MVAAALWLCVPVFHGEITPLKLGIEYGANKYPDLARQDVCNLPAILQDHFGWQTDDPATTLELHFWPFQSNYPLTLKQLLWGVYVLTVVLCAIGAAVQDRRRDTRMLIALAAPWILFFALVPQMHQRYLVWAAGITAIVGSLDFGLLVLHLLVTGLAWGMQAHTVLKADPTFAPQTLRFLVATYPGTGWMILLIGAIFLYLAVMPGGRPLRPSATL
jgi:hypothetical protein